MWVGRAGHVSGGEDRYNLQPVDKQLLGASEEHCDSSQQYEFPTAKLPRDQILTVLNTKKKR